MREKRERERQRERERKRETERERERDGQTDRQTDRQRGWERKKFKWKTIYVVELRRKEGRSTRDEKEREIKR